MTTTASTTQVTGNGQTRPALRAPIVVPPKGRRRPSLIVAGVALATLGALVAVWLVASAGQRTGVVVLARDVPYGAVLTAEDVRVAQVSLEPEVGSVAADAMETVVGQVAAVDLVAGAVLAPGQVTTAGPPGAGEVVVPLPLPPARVPARGLVPGDRLLVVDTPPEQAEPPTGEPASFEVIVAAVGPADLNGVVVVDVVAATGDGPALAARAATGRFALVVQPAEVTP